MTATDTAALQERIARALYENAEYYGPEDAQPPWEERDGEERGEWMEVAAAVLPAIAAAEHRIARLEAQTDVRGRAVVIYRERAREAEAQIKAVQELHCSDGHGGTCGEPDCFESCTECFEDYPCPTIRALESVTPPRA